MILIILIIFDIELYVSLCQAPFSIFTSQHGPKKMMKKPLTQQWFPNEAMALTSPICHWIPPSKPDVGSCEPL